MTDQRDPRLAEFTEADLRRELRLRAEAIQREFFNALSPCPECGAPICSFDSKVVEEFKSAPKWQGWPAPPPPHLEQIDGQRIGATLTCENGHETYREEVRFKDSVKA